MGSALRYLFAMYMSLGVASLSQSVQCFFFVSSIFELSVAAALSMGGVFRGGLEMVCNLA